MPEVPSTATVVIVGFGLVFMILLILVLVLNLEGRIFAGIDKRKKQKAAAVAAAAEVITAPAPAPAAPVIEDGIPPEVVAAIAAAIAAMDGGKYTLRSLTRKKDGRSPWNVAATVSYTQPF